MRMKTQSSSELAVLAVWHHIGDGEVVGEHQEASAHSMVVSDDREREPVAAWPRACINGGGNGGAPATSAADRDGKREREV